MTEVLKLFIFGGLGFLILYTLAYFMRVSKEDAREMGIVTPEMSRDPEEIERIERETPLHIKAKREEALNASKESQISDYEEGEDGVMRRKKY